MAIFFSCMTFLSGREDISFWWIPHLPATNWMILGKSSFLILSHFWSCWEDTVSYDMFVCSIKSWCYHTLCLYTRVSPNSQSPNSLIFWDWAQLWSFQYLLSLIIMMVFVLLSKRCRTIYKVRSEWWMELVSLMSYARILMKGKWRQSAVGVLLGQQYSLGSTWPPSYFPLRKWFLL